MSWAEIKDNLEFYLPAAGSFLIALAGLLVFYLVYRFIRARKK